MTMLLFSAMVEQTTPMCYAEVTEVTDGKLTKSRVSLARDRFPTVAARREEILRQLRQAAASR